jgi:DNA-binding transcriptional regulator YbjK
MSIQVTEEAVTVSIPGVDLAAIAAEARAEFDELGTDEAMRVMYVRLAIAERQSALVAEWMDATRKTVEGFIGQLKDHPMLSMFGDNPFGG